MKQPAIMASRPDHYARFGITHEIQPFEDGLRTDPSRPGHYEWWYFDAHLDDGSKLVVTFFTKDAASPGTGLKPSIELDLDLPDGRSIHRTASFEAAQFQASTERCDVRLGDNRFTGDLHEYRITAELGDLSINVRLVGETQPWRPHTGIIVYGQDEQDYFAWLPSVPHGSVSVTYRLGETETATTGHGYHDHNWGNVALPSVVDNWYWGRGQAGPYTFITADIVTGKKYGYAQIPVFMLAKDGKVVADDETKVTFSTSGVQIDADTGKPVADVHGYRYDDGAAAYDVRYTRAETILRTRFIDGTSGLKRLVAQLAGFDGSYLRFRGDVEVAATVDGRAGEPVRDAAVWEIMYFGKNGHEAGKSGHEARGSQARP